MPTAMQSRKTPVRSGRFRRPRARIESPRPACRTEGFHSPRQRCRSTPRLLSRCVPASRDSAFTPPCAAAMKSASGCSSFAPTSGARRWPANACNARQRLAGGAQAQDCVARWHHPHRDVAAGAHSAPEGAGAEAQVVLSDDRFKALNLADPIPGLGRKGEFDGEWTGHSPVDAADGCRRPRAWTDLLSRHAAGMPRPVTDPARPTAVSRATPRCGRLARAPTAGFSPQQ